MIEPTIVLLIWPLIALIIIRVRGMASGAIWVIVTGYLFLPDSFNVNLPGLPPYSKYTAISFGLVLAVLFLAKRDEEDPVVLADKLASRIIVALAVILMISPLFTMIDNRSVLIDGPTVRSALSFRDVLSMSIRLGIVLVPYYVGRRWCATPDQHARILTVILVMGLIYSLLVLFEARMSPQLNRWTYGYFPHSWRQHFRGGFRPVVFLRHGLWLGFFILTVILAALALARHKKQGWLLYVLAAVWMMGVLLISRNLGATLLAFVFAPIVLFLGPRTQVRIAAVIAIAFLLHPLLRQSGVIDFSSFVNWIASFAPDRASSLQFRLDNEADLLARAFEKPLFGWGGWARQFLYDDRGRILSTVDGLWIVMLGERGWVGFLAYFGLITVPLIMLGRTVRRKPLEPATAGLAMLTAVNLIYVVPNSAMSSIGWLVFGALAGYVHNDVRAKDALEPEELSNEGRPRNLRYTRFAPGQARRSVSLKR